MQATRLTWISICMVAVSIESLNVGCGDGPPLGTLDAAPPDADIRICEGPRDAVPTGWRIDRTVSIGLDGTGEAEAGDIVLTDDDVSLLRRSFVERVPLDGSEHTRWDVPAGLSVRGFSRTLVAGWLQNGNENDVGFCRRDTTPAECVVVGQADGTFAADAEPDGAMRLWWTDGSPAGTVFEVRVSADGVVGSVTPIHEQPTHQHLQCAAAGGPGRLLAGYEPGICQSIYFNLWRDEAALPTLHEVAHGSHSAGSSCEAEAVEIGYFMLNGWDCFPGEGGCQSRGTSVAGSALMMARWDREPRTVVVDTPMTHGALAADGTVWAVGHAGAGRLRIVRASLDDGEVHDGELDVQSTRPLAEGHTIHTVIADETGLWIDLMIYDKWPNEFLLHVVPDDPAP